MIPTRRGVFNAVAPEIGVAPSGANNLITVTCRFVISEEEVGGETVDVQAENFDIPGYFYVEKKDGTINEHAVKALKDAFGWDGRDVMQLQDDPKYTSLPVQIVVDEETYEGKTRMKVKFLNAYGSSGGAVKKSDAAAGKAIAAKLGSKLRALSGAAPAAPKPAAPAAGKPATPAAPAAPARRSPPSGRPSAALTAMTLEQAWEAFIKDAKQFPQDHQEREWLRLLAEMFPGRDQATLTGAEWAQFAKEAPKKIAKPGEIPEADIPF